MAEPMIWRDASGVIHEVSGTNPMPANAQVQTGVVLASAAYTTSQTSADITNTGGRGLVVFLNTTVIGTGSVTVTINGKNPTTGTYYPLLVGAAVVTNTFNTYSVGQGLPATANASANAPVPAVFQVVVTANNANSAVYDVSYLLSP
jgi:hypothetical protein